MYPSSSISFAIQFVAGRTRSSLLHAAFSLRSHPGYAFSAHLASYARALLHAAFSLRHPVLFDTMSNVSGRRKSTRAGRLTAKAAERLVDTAEAAAATAAAAGAGGEQKDKAAAAAAATPPRAGDDAGGSSSDDDDGGTMSLSTDEVAQCRTMMAEMARFLAAARSAAPAPAAGTAAAGASSSSPALSDAQLMEAISRMPQPGGKAARKERKAAAATVPPAAAGGDRSSDGADGKRLDRRHRSSRSRSSSGSSYDSASSGSESDSDSRRSRRLRDVARQGWKQVKDAGCKTVSQWVAALRLPEGRDLHECVQWALAIDEGRRGPHKVPRDHPMVEVAFRRLQGVVLAVQNNNWNLCTAIQQTPPSSMLISREQFGVVMKEAKYRAAIGNKASGTRGSAASGGKKKGPGKKGRGGGAAAAAAAAAPAKKP